MSNQEQYTDEDMANVGRALMTAIQEFMPDGWHPMDCPSEAIGDLCCIIDDLKAELAERNLDAERYKFLRLDDNWCEDVSIDWAALGELSGSEFDAAVDATMKASAEFH